MQMKHDFVFQQYHKCKNKCESGGPKPCGKSLKQEVWGAASQKLQGVFIVRLHTVILLLTDNLYIVNYSKMRKENTVHCYWP